MTTTAPTVTFTVKVLVDGAWESAGHFRSPQKAEQAARVLSDRLQRPVAIRDASGMTIAEHYPMPRKNDVGTPHRAFANAVGVEA